MTAQPTIVPRVREIIAAVTWMTNVSREDIIASGSGRPSKEVGIARAAVMYVAHECYGMALEHIGYYAGDRTAVGVNSYVCRVRAGLVPEALDMVPRIKSLAEHYAVERWRRETGKGPSQARGLPMVRVTTQSLVLEFVNRPGRGEPGDPDNKTWWEKGNDRFARAMQMLTPEPAE
jgi:hypothetical protein